MISHFHRLQEPAMPEPRKPTIITVNSVSRNSDNSNNYTSARAILDGGDNQATSFECPACSSKNVFEDDQGYITCHNCGHLLAENVSLHVSSEGPDVSGYTRVNNLGRPFVASANFQRRTTAPYESQERRRIYRGKRYAQIRDYLIAAGHSNGLVMTDVNRSYHLWRRVMSISPLQFWTPAARAALACLYLAAKESKRGLSLVQIAVRAEMSPYDIGATYKLIKSILIKQGFLDPNQECFNTEEDPWIVLERILTFGSTDSIQRGDMDELSHEIQDAFGIGKEPEERSFCLRGLLSSAQKCMTIAIDSGLVTGRYLHAMVAACLLVAVQVQLQLVQIPEELVHFVTIAFTSGLNTVKDRYKELKKCMLVWARRLPFVKSAGKIKDTKLVYYLDDVLKYFGHLEEQNKRLWAALDEATSADFKGDNSGDDTSDRIGPGEFISEEDLVFEQEDTSPWNLDDDVQDDENIMDIMGITDRDIEMDEDHGTQDEEKPVERLYPPAYIASINQRAKKAEHLELAKESLSGSCEQGDHGEAKIKSDRELQRIDMIKQLLMLGNRSEQELLDATDNTLSYWISADQAKAAGETTVRSNENLDSTELTPEDMTDREMETYLRSKPEREAMWRVMGPVYVDAELQAQNLALKRTLQKDRRQHRKRASDRKRKPAADMQSHTTKRIRSSKLCLEALGDAEGDGGSDSGARDDQAIDEYDGGEQGLVRDETWDPVEDIEADGHNDDDYGAYDEYDDYGD
ncbi:hypothetical protein BG011_003864 [Mortierella polycephala]|uniref:BRF2-like C-terminal domain-containing protein n=1 Tax=Mortierella polycephala TaxID=41804 RepID=A0A9P6Q056_9FUNG|nr:hypothetical protein BG011_003864 [Mortierella polycephala]